MRLLLPSPTNDQDADKDALTKSRHKLLSIMVRAMDFQLAHLVSVRFPSPARAGATHRGTCAPPPRPPCCPTMSISHTPPHKQRKALDSVKPLDEGERVQLAEAKEAVDPPALHGKLAIALFKALYTHLGHDELREPAGRAPRRGRG